mmetsp:Transcript_31977/g.32605  ORF Transcript_31977/g.32605 Transcript_31977/m.32605 type:complete len:91 (+) Transcript_31977:434-706(+)
MVVFGRISSYNPSDLSFISRIAISIELIACDPSSFNEPSKENLSPNIPRSTYAFEQGMFDAETERVIKRFDISIEAKNIESTINHKLRGK